MDTITVVVVVVVVALVAVAVAAFAVAKRRRSTQLKQQFGSEYERTVDEAGDRGTAEKDLKRREKRRSQFEVSPLSSASADRYREEWKNIQQRFVDEPGHAVEDADRLVVRMMRECGYPVDEFDQRADDISVDHPDVSQNYREAHRVAVAQSQGQADTEQLRQAVTSYRRLVDALLEDGGVTDQGRSPGTTGTQEQR
jgi:FtsZ-interacting cell division protein ZipA